MTKRKWEYLFNEELEETIDKGERRQISSPFINYEIMGIESVKNFYQCFKNMSTTKAVTRNLYLNIEMVNNHVVSSNHPPSHVVKAIKGCDHRYENILMGKYMRLSVKIRLHNNFWEQDGQIIHNFLDLLCTIFDIKGVTIQSNIYQEYLYDFFIPFFKARSPDFPFQISLSDRCGTRVCETKLCRAISVLSADVNCITALDFSGINLDNNTRTCSELGRMIQHSSTLKKVVLKDCNIWWGNKGVECILKCLARNRSVTHFDISHNCIQDEVVNTLHELLTTNRTLTHLNISGIQDFLVHDWFPLSLVRTALSGNGGTLKSLMMNNMYYLHDDKNFWNNLGYIFHDASLHSIGLDIDEIHMNYDNREETFIDIVGKSKTIKKMFLTGHNFNPKVVLKQMDVIAQILERNESIEYLGLCHRLGYPIRYGNLKSSKNSPDEIKVVSDLFTRLDKALAQNETLIELWIGDPITTQRTWKNMEFLRYNHESPHVCRELSHIGKKVFRDTKVFTNEKLWFLLAYHHQHSSNSQTGRRLLKKIPKRILKHVLSTNLKFRQSRELVIAHHSSGK